MSNVRIDHKTNKKRSGKKVGGRISLWIATSVTAGSQRTSFKADISVSRSIFSSTKVNTEKDNTIDYNCVVQEGQ